MVAPFQTPMASRPSTREIALLDLGVLSDHWNRLTVAQKADLIAKKFPGADRIALITKLDAAHPSPPLVHYRERTVYVPAGALAPSTGPSTPGGMSIMGWGLLLLVAGGLYYATVNQR